MKSNRFWFAVIGTVLLVSAAVSVLVFRRESGGVACVYLDGVLIERIELSQSAGPYTFTVTCDDGYNVIAVENGRIFVVEADCRDGTCMRQGVLRGVIPIVCLPHRLVISFESAKHPEIDAEAG